ncbi:hypothetical protein [Mycobacterium sp. 852014-52144_SCH5372336]|uniref:hypothetical protein n=1 Tax=Mycobacterium sp. 852014-52144_SCH5372336 TaxID=1834115 RepID=UPI000800841C|nr:hypothetical protein [Mycobacterium sp. 852014-52144_SCH5372336]OBB77391.1 hypothetical protein A5759_03880 [Mycobacterium sp. 852014-52144_SCH5372336]
MTESTARLALVDATNPESVLDQFDVSVAGGSTGELLRTIVDTNRTLSTDGYRLTATNIVWSDEALAGRLRGALSESGVGNVSVVSASDAARAYVRSAANSTGQHTSALILVDETAAALSVVGPDATTTSLVDAEEIAPGGPDAACTAMIERLREEPGGAQRLYVISTATDSAALIDRLATSSPIPMHTASGTAYLLSRGAALAGGVPNAAAPDQYFTAPSPVMGEHLAYSMAEDSGSMPLGVAGEYDEGDAPLQTPMSPLRYVHPTGVHTDDPDEFDAPAATGRPRILLLGSTVAAAVIVGFAVLAVGVAISIAPTASEQTVRDAEAVPGKYLPPMPGQAPEPVEDLTEYLPPVVPISATAPQTGAHTGYAGGAPTGTGAYSPSSGSTGAGPVVPSSGGAGAVPAGVPNPMPVNPLNGFKVSDWLPNLPDLPDNLTINLPTGLSRCGADDPLCFLAATSCYPNRSGTLKCLEQRGFIVPTTDEDEIEKPAECSGEPLNASCVLTQPLDQTEDTANPDGPDGSDDPAVSRPGGFDESDTNSDESRGTSEGRTPADQSDGGTPASPPEPSSTPTTRASKPEPTPSSAVPTPRSDEPTPSSPRQVTSSAAPAPPKPPSPAVQAPPPPPAVEEEPAPAPAPAVEEEPAPAPAPAPVVDAPAPIVEAPAPAPAPAPVVEAPAPPPVVAPQPVSPPDSSGSSSGGSDSGSSSGGSDSGSSTSSEYRPVTTPPSVP